MPPSASHAQLPVRCPIENSRQTSAEILGRSAAGGSRAARRAGSSAATSTAASNTRTRGGGGLRLGLFLELPVTFRHADRLTGLPPHHRDPFDRMLVAQAAVEELALVTRDRVFARYGVALIEA